MRSIVTEGARRPIAVDGDAPTTASRPPSPVTRVRRRS